MRDIDFCVILVATMLSTYYGRGEKNEEFLRRFDNEFPESAQILARLKAVFAFIDEMNLDHGSRAFKKTDLLTLLVELDVVLNNQRLELDARQAGRELSTFYDAVDTLFKKPGAKVKAAVKSDAIAKYLKAATKATNDKYARMDRAEVISALLVSTVTRAKRKKEK